MTGRNPPDAIGRMKGDRLGEELASAALRYSPRVIAAVRHAMAIDEKARPQSVADWRPSLLGSGVSTDNVFFRANLTNRPLPPLGDQATTPEGVIHVERSRFLWQERLYERLTLTNYGERDVPAPVTLEFDADFADIFEVRGHARARRGQRMSPEVSRSRVVFRYVGLDDVERVSAIAFSQTPDVLDARHAAFSIVLPRHAKTVLHVEIGPDADTPPGRARFRGAAARARRAMRAKRGRGGSLTASGRLFNLWIGKSRADLALLETDLPTGPYPFAGIPWFSTPFGRDAIITALQTLWLDPALARGVLTFLARHQAKETSSFADAAPGKIMHETRKGEMAALREVPFGRYYGGVDSTPLFVMLAGAYAERTGDLAFLDTLWPALIAAMAWIEGPGDSNGDGFLDYARGEASGLANQGWKDSVDSIFHADGRLPHGPIALLEVQGYVYAAYRAMADLARRRGDDAGQARWHERALRLRAAVEARFWMDDCGFYAIALDGDGKLCRVRASNAGHLLYTGLPSPEHAQQVARQLLASTFDNGWGIRTMNDGAARFNPMSYHNGSVWPHDNALIGMGLARYGMKDRAMAIMSAMFDASASMDLHRVPELFCGFVRRSSEGPTLYPVACSPQAWASGSVFYLLQACLGLSFRADPPAVHFTHPQLPDYLARVDIRNLRVGASVIDLSLHRHTRDVGVNVLRKEGDVQISVEL